MPRKTHPTPVRKHSRRQTRASFERYARRRFNQAKARLGNDPWAFELDLQRAGRRRELGLARIDELRELLDSPGPIFYLHPELQRREARGPRREFVCNWPFLLSPGQLADDNPFTLCSCWWCRCEEPHRRVRERRRWEREAAEDLADWEEDR